MAEKSTQVAKKTSFAGDKAGNYSGLFYILAVLAGYALVSFDVNLEILFPLVVGLLLYFGAFNQPGKLHGIVMSLIYTVFSYFHASATIFSHEVHEVTCEGPGRLLTPAPPQYDALRFFPALGLVFTGILIYYNFRPTNARSRLYIPLLLWLPVAAFYVMSYMGK